MDSNLHKVVVDPFRENQLFIFYRNNRMSADTTSGYPIDESARRQRQQELSAEFAIFSLRTDELEPVLQEACRVAAQGMGCTLAKVLEFLPAENCFLMRAGIGWQPGNVGYARLGADLESPAGYAFQTGKPVLSNHLANEMRFRTPRLLIAHGVRRAFNVLVPPPGERFGVLEVDSLEERDFNVSDTAFLQNLATTIAQSITNHRRLAELRHSHAFAQGILNASPDCLKVLSLEGDVLFMNHSGVEMNELSSFEDVRGKEFAAMWPIEEQSAIRAAIEKAAAGEAVRVEGFCPTATGQPRWWDLSFAPLPADGDRPERIIGVSRDASERHMALAALRRSEAELRHLNEILEQRVEEQARAQDKLWQLSEDLLVIASYDGALIQVSPSWTRLTGYDIATLKATPYRELIHPDDLARVEALLDQIWRTGQPRHYQNRVFARDGKWRHISWTLSPEPGSDLFLGVGRDVTSEREDAEQKLKLEAQLRQSQKMEAVGQLTGGLAHDFNNLLTGVIGSLELLNTRVRQGSFKDAARYILAAQGAANRAAALTHRLLAFSRRQTLDPKPTDVNRLVAGMEELIQRTAGPAVEVRAVLLANLWTTLVDSGQLENALLNLCINARDAMPDGGQLVIETENKRFDEQMALARDMEPGEYLSLCVSDTGTGMTPEVAAKALDPFFTTKPLGQGTGLGLSMIYGFTKQSGGQVRIHSAVGQGTTVCLYIPRHLGQANTVDQPSDLAKAPRAEQGRTVLVVDDEDTIRMLVTEVLEDFGYIAIEAANGATALNILRSNVRIDLMVTDVGLPGGMNGRQLADGARVVRPLLKVLFITGYAESIVVEKGHLDSGMHILTKPFPMEVLANRINTLMHEK